LVLPLLLHEPPVRRHPRRGPGRRSAHRRSRGLRRMRVQPARPGATGGIMKERPRERARLRGLADREGIDMGNVTTATAEVTINGDGPYPCEVEITQQVEMGTSVSAARAGARWSHTDSSGHFHACAEGGKLPTLRREDVEVPCDGSCGFEGGCDGYTVPEYHCVICDEIVEPQRVPDYVARS